jgi:hypothetical protein
VEVTGSLVHGFQGFERRHHRVGFAVFSEQDEVHVSAENVLADQEAALKIFGGDVVLALGEKANVPGWLPERAGSFWSSACLSAGAS